MFSSILLATLLALNPLPDHPKESHHVTHRPAVAHEIVHKTVTHKATPPVRVRITKTVYVSRVTLIERIRTRYYMNTLSFGPRFICYPVDLYPSDLSLLSWNTYEVYVVTKGPLGWFIARVPVTNLPFSGYYFYDNQADASAKLAFLEANEEVLSTTCI